MILAQSRFESVAHPAIGKSQRAAIRVMNYDELVNPESRIQEKDIPDRVADMAASIAADHDHWFVISLCTLHSALLDVLSPFGTPRFRSMNLSTLHRVSTQATANV